VTMASTALPARAAAFAFASFAFAYFFSALVRGVTATLAPSFSGELGLTAADLGLLAGAYFGGFALMQLPLGSALDRFGPRRVLLAFLSVAVLGCIAFASARHFATLTLARALIGVGVSACLMAPMTAFRRHFDPVLQLRANSWMLMTGAFGMVAGTLPVQWLLPLIGWRGLFWLVAALIVLAMVAIRAFVPPDNAAAPPAIVPGPSGAGGYAEVWKHPTFVRFLPMGFFQYGGMIAVQSLWAGPWLVQVCGWSAREAASGLFVINLAMLFAFFGWGIVVPRLYARGWTAQSLITRGAPLGLLALLLAIVLGERATAWAWALYCVGCTFVTLSQPAIGQAFPTTLAGRALSAFNLVVFAGIFAVQWGLGVAIDTFVAMGWPVVSAYRAAMALLATCGAVSYLWFLWHDDAPAAAAKPAARA